MLNLAVVMNLPNLEGGHRCGRDCYFHAEHELRWPCRLYRQLRRREGLHDEARVHEEPHDEAKVHEILKDAAGVRDKLHA